MINAELTDEGRDVLGRLRALLSEWVRVDFAEHLSSRETRELGALLRKLLESHGRWEGQMAHLRGYREGPGP